MSDPSISDRTADKSMSLPSLAAMRHAKCAPLSSDRAADKSLSLPSPRHHICRSRPNNYKGRAADESTSLPPEATKSGPQCPAIGRGSTTSQRYDATPQPLHDHCTRGRLLSGPAHACNPTSPYKPALPKTKTKTQTKESQNGSAGGVFRGGPLHEAAATRPHGWLEGLASPRRRRGYKLPAKTAVTA